MQLGLSEYLPKPLTRDMVQLQLRPKLIGDVAPDPTDRGGHVISICGAQGGAGATSIAINLALDENIWQARARRYANSFAWIDLESRRIFY
jgi:hypothetical protein